MYFSFLGMGTRIQVAIYLLLFLSIDSNAQNPIIFSVDKQQAAPGEVVTIHGSDFGTDPSQVKVFFGGTDAAIKSISNQILEVRTPTGSTFDQVRVINTTSGRSATAPAQFFLNYQGEGGIAAATFDTQADFQAQSGLYDVCLCDFDNDRKVDVATASNSANLVTVFRNASTPGNVNLIAQNITIGARTLHVRCGDLNGDGRPDLVLSEGSDGSRIFVLTNTGALTFSQQAITLTGAKVKQIALADLDLDGRQDIIVTNTGGNLLYILPNSSAAGTTNFGSPLAITIPGASSTDALSVADLDADGYPDIATSQYQADNENKLYILRNQGSFNFSDIHTIVVNKAVSNIRIADLDADTKPDIAIARLTGSDVSIYLNNSGTQLSFRDPSFFITETLPVGVDFGDFDGDGKLDIAVSSIAKSVSVLKNGSATGTSAFDPVVKVSSTFINRNLRNADIDGDGKPDIVFTSVDDFSGVPVPASKVSILRNLSCMVPRISPGGPLNVCVGSPLQLTATIGGGITYQWFREGDASPVKSGTEHFLNVTDPGIYHVTALSASPACSRQSSSVEVSFSPPAGAISASNPDARSNSPVCTNNALLLEVNNVGATAYRWTGPAGFSRTVTTTTLERPSFSMAHAGLYVVEILSGTCVAKTDSVLVEAITIPDFVVQHEGASAFCANDTKTLTIAPFLASGFSYQWYEKNMGIIQEATFENFVANAPGEYFVLVTPDNGGCTPTQSTTVTLSAVEPPVADFQAAESGCQGVAVAFAQQAHGTAGMDLVYSWTFGDGKTSGDANPSNIYMQANTFEVSLKVFYPGLESCSATATKHIEIFTVTAPQIAASHDAMCAGEEVSLSVEGAYSQITWSTNESQTEITVTTPGTYAVSTIDLIGCAAEDEIVIDQKPLPDITVSADQEVIAPGQTVQLEAHGADTYTWSPGKTMNDSTVAAPRASPASTTTYTVTGSIIDGCEAMAAITIQVSGEMVNISVPVLFSPNGDDINPILVIEGVENYPDCSFNVFDRRGGRVFESKGYQNNWDGTYNGAPLPEGVYYYLFGCPDRKSVTGTVTIIR